MQNQTEHALAEIRAFVAGTMSPDEFRSRLYSDNSFEALLTNDPHLPKSGYIKASVYQFLLQQDFDDPGDLLNVQGALSEFLDRNGFAYVATKSFSDFFDLIRKAQPGWLDVPTKFVQEKMLPSASGRTGKDLQAWLKAEFLRLFRFAKKPPKWIQSPDWPINQNGPLVFLGQFDVKDYFHDSASVFVFHDQTTGSCETVIQVY